VRPAIPLRASAAASSKRITAAIVRTLRSSHARALSSRRSVGWRATTSNTRATASGNSATIVKNSHCAT
jgi:hypothetical protein